MNSHEKKKLKLKGIKLVSNSISYGPCPEPDDEVEQHLSIIGDGRVFFSRYSFGEGFGGFLLTERRNFKIDPSAAGYILNRIEGFYSSNNDEFAVTDVGSWEITLTNEDGSKDKGTGCLYPMGGELQSISDLIRYHLNMPDLLCFDGRANEDRIENIKIEYHRTTKIKPKEIPEGATWQFVTWQYGESIEVDRKTETITHIQNIAQECSVKREYHVSEGVSSFLDGLDAAELFASVVGNPPDIKENPLEEKTYDICITYLYGEQRTIKGSFDRYGLPDDYPEFADELFEFMRFYGLGELLDPAAFGKAVRRESELIFCNVQFEDYGKTYCYLTDDETIDSGDQVVVPVGADNHESVATVESIEYHAPEEAPYPMEKIKKVLRKVVHEEVEPEDDNEESQSKFVKIQAGSVITQDDGSTVEVPETVYVIAQEPVPGKNADEYYRDNGEELSDAELAALLATAWNEAGWLLDEASEDDCPSDVRQRYQGWEQLQSTLIARVGEQNGSQPPETGLYEYLKPFMGLHGYEASGGWWISKADQFGGGRTSEVIEENVTVAKTPLCGFSVVDNAGALIPFDIVRSWNTDHSVYIDNDSSNIQEVKTYHEFVIRIPTAALSIRKWYYVISDESIEFLDSDERLFTLGLTRGTISMAISFPDPNEADKDGPYDLPPKDFHWFDFNQVNDRKVEFMLLDREREYIYLPVAWIEGITDHLQDYEGAVTVFTWII